MFLWILLLLLLVTPISAEETPSWSQEGGQLKLDGGTLYVPATLHFESLPNNGGLVLVGAGSGSETVCIVLLDKPFELSNASAVDLLKEYLIAPLKDRAQKADSLASVGSSRELSLADKSVKEILSLGDALPLREVVSANYPWDDSLEVRLDTVIPVSCYVSSGSGKTMIITALGPQGPETANSIAASYKEKLAFRRNSQARENSAHQIQTLLGTGNTFLLIFSLFVPMALVTVFNRKKGVNHNPFDKGIKGLFAGGFLALVFSYVLLSRFSWAGVGDYAQAFAGTAVRFVFLLLVANYFSKRWGSRFELGD